MSNHQHYGTQDKYTPSERRHDIRKPSTRIHEQMLSSDGSFFLLVIIGVVCVLCTIIPLFGIIAFIVSFILTKVYAYPRLRIYDFPFRVPTQARLFDGSLNKQFLDYIFQGDVRKKNPRAFWGNGVTYWGVCTETNLPFFSSNSDDRTHSLVLGTTGSGKTQQLLGQASNQLIQNSGFIFMDGKGDPSLYASVSRLLRIFGREDDALILNFITSNRNVNVAQKDKMTNTFNLMANTAASTLIELLSGLLPETGSGDGMWQERAITFISSLTKVLCYLRDIGEINLSPESFIEYTELAKVEELVWEHNGKFGKEFEIVASSLRTYLSSLAGYQKSKIKRQPEEPSKQHGFIVMQLTSSLNTLMYDYGYIFGVEEGDIDMFDCILNRRVLIIPMPALEKAESRIRMLGKLIFSSIKQMMAGSLGNRVEGLYREILGSRATNAATSYKVFMDEVGYIIVKGVSVMPAQGRSLGFSLTFAAQTFEDIEKADKNEAAAIEGNTKIKAYGKSASGDSSSTLRQALSLGGKEFQAEHTSVEKKFGDIFDKHIESNNIQFVERNRISPDDLAAQEEGEFHLVVAKKLNGGKKAKTVVVRVRSFYVDGDPLTYLRVNDLCPNLSVNKSRLTDPLERVEKIVNSLESRHKGYDDNSVPTTGNSVPPKIGTTFEAIRKKFSTLLEQQNIPQEELAPYAFVEFFIDQFKPHLLENTSSVQAFSSSSKSSSILKKVDDDTMEENRTLINKDKSRELQRMSTSSSSEDISLRNTKDLESSNISIHLEELLQTHKELPLFNLSSHDSILLDEIKDNVIQGLSESNFPEFQFLTQMLQPVESLNSSQNASKGGEKSESFTKLNEEAILFQNDFLKAIQVTLNSNHFDGNKLKREVALEVKDRLDVFAKYAEATTHISS